MAEVTKTGVPSPSTGSPGFEHRLTGLITGEAVAGGDALYIKGSDGKLYKGLGDDETTASVCGFAAMPASAGEPATVVFGIFMGYGPKVSGTAMQGGKPLYLSATVAGGLADAPTASGTVPIAWTVGDGRIFVSSNWLAGQIPEEV